MELRLEYRTVAKADSGIYLRGNPQIQIWDTTEAGGKWNLGAQSGSGGLWNNSPGAPGKDPLVKADKPFGQWNSVRIVQVGERTWVWLNDKATVVGARMENYWDRKVPLWPTGPIQLQTHGGEIRWRNIMGRDIRPEEANRWLAELDPQGFTPIFNGKSWTGWSGPTERIPDRRRRALVPPGQGRHDLHHARVRGLRRSYGIQPAARRKQRARDPISG